MTTKQKRIKALAEIGFTPSQIADIFECDGNDFLLDPEEIEVMQISRAPGFCSLNPRYLSALEEIY